jgi:hypothetical protein
MHRSAFTSAAVLFCSFALVSPAFAQVKKTAPKTEQAKPATDTAKPSGAPAAPAKWVAPLKGLAHIEIIKGPSKKEGSEVVTVTKVKNVSDAPIALLRMDELWYNSKNEQVTGDTYVLRRPFQAGEIIEITTRSPYKPDLKQSQLMFTHANGKMDVKAVKAFK